MGELVFVAPPGAGGVQLKYYLRRERGMSARLLAKLKREPLGLCVNGAPARATDRLRPGDRISLRLPEDRKQAEPRPLALPIVYEDEVLLLVEKPCGMPAHPSPGHDHDTLMNAVAWHFSQTGGPGAVRAVYRLDKDTTGLVAVAKNAYAAAALAGQIEKEYLAVCEGYLYGEGTVDAPIALKEGHGIQRAVSPAGVPAVTHWRALARRDGYTLLLLRLETGRTHQIRVHMASIGHPLAGDDMYGGSLRRVTRQALHCRKVSFCHPVTGAKMTFCSPLPEDLWEFGFPV